MITMTYVMYDQRNPISMSSTFLAGKGRERTYQKTSNLPIMEQNMSIYWKVPLKAMTIHSVLSIRTHDTRKVLSYREFKEMVSN